MVTTFKQTRMSKRSFRVGVISGVTAVSLLLLIWVRANALQFVGGAYGCGAIGDAIANVQEGKTVIPMVPERDSAGAVIDRNMVIQGGWDIPGGSGDCNGENANPSILGKSGLRDAGFVFTAPLTRSELTEGTDLPVLSISANVTELAIEHMQIREDDSGTFATVGGGISGTLQNSAEVRLTNVLITDSTSSDSGGGMYLELRDGSTLLIEGSEFVGNTSDQGGGIELHVYDGSMVTIMNSTFEGNQADSGDGGAIRLVMYGGTVNIMNSVFENNSASGSGGAIQIVGMSGSSEVCITNSTFNGNSAASNSDVGQSGSGVTVCNLGNSVFLPTMLKDFPPTTDQARITGITLNDDYEYEVEFETYNFTAVMPGQHVHFFFNTVDSTEAGVPGSGPWIAYGGGSPFTNYDDTDKPPLATHMCILVANQNHSVQQNTGNCYRLPVNK